MTNTFAEPGIVRSGWISTRPARSSGTPSAAPSGDAATPAAHRTVCRCDRRRSRPRRVPATRRSRSSWSARRRRAAADRCARPRAGLRETREDRRPAFEQEDPRRARIEMPEVACERLPRDLGERAGHLDAGRPAADHDEGQQRRPLRRIGLALRALERQQHAPPDLERILERLEARARRAATRRVRSTRGSPRWRRSGSRSRARRPPGAGDCPRGRRRRPRRAAPRRSAAGGGSSGSATRCRRARAPPSPPDTAAAGTRDGCGDRRP